MIKGLDKLIDELYYKVTIGPEGINTLWERKLELWLRPKPKWMSDFLWSKIVSMVLVQVERSGGTK